MAARVCDDLFVASAVLSLSKLRTANARTGDNVPVVACTQLEHDVAVLAVSAGPPLIGVTPGAPTADCWSVLELGVGPRGGAGSRPSKHNMSGLRWELRVDMVVFLVSRSVVKTNNCTNVLPWNRTTGAVEFERRIRCEQHVSSPRSDMPERHERPPILDSEKVPCD